MLLFAYGFALPTNPFDTVSLELKRCREGGTADNLGIFYLSAGGIEGIPKASSMY